MRSFDGQLFGLVSELSLINLNNNLLCELPAELPWNNLNCIKVITLSHNQLSCLPPQLCCHPTLEELDCSYNLLEQLPANAFQGCSRLRQLDLSSNRLTSVESLSATLHSCLCVLRLSGNHLHSLPTVIYEMQLLQELLLDRNQLSTFASGTFLPGSDSHNMEISAAFSGLKQLRTLNLRCNHITSLPLAFFDWLPELYSFDMADNLLTWTEVQRFPSYDRWVKSLDKHLKKKNAC